MGPPRPRDPAADSYQELRQELLSWEEPRKRDPSKLKTVPIVLFGKIMCLKKQGMQKALV